MTLEVKISIAETEVWGLEIYERDKISTPSGNTDYTLNLDPVNIKTLLPGEETKVFLHSQKDVVLKEVSLPE